MCQLRSERRWTAEVYFWPSGQAQRVGKYLNVAGPTESMQSQHRRFCSRQDIFSTESREWPKKSLDLLKQAISRFICSKAAPDFGARRGTDADHFSWLHLDRVVVGEIPIIFFKKPLNRIGNF